MFFYSIIIVFTLTFIQIPNKNPEIIYFNVGNADSFLIKSPSNDYFMIDTAKSGYKGTSTAAKNIIIKYMRDKGIKNLYALILSHFDDDHAGGTIDILKNINVKKMYSSDVVEDTNISESIQNYIKENSINEEIVTDIKKIYDKDEFQITIIKPKGNFIKSENQKSLIVHINNNGQNFLFMGDGDINSYNGLQEKYKQNIKVIKSGHHGAKNTVNKEMADNLQKNGGYIPGVRPGEDTVKYVNSVLYRITFVGSLALTILAALPIIFGMVAPDLPSTVSIGGTGLLIVVGVALETYKQVEGSLAMTSYRKGRRNR